MLGLLCGVVGVILFSAVLTEHRMSVTSWSSTKMAKTRITQTTPYNSPWL